MYYFYDLLLCTFRPYEGDKILAPSAGQEATRVGKALYSQYYDNCNLLDIVQHNIVPDQHCLDSIFLLQIRVDIFLKIHQDI
jgi:hypothetical protein